MPQTSNRPLAQRRMTSLLDLEPVTRLLDLVLVTSPADPARLLDLALLTRLLDLRE